MQRRVGFMFNEIIVGGPTLRYLVNICLYMRLWKAEKAQLAIDFDMTAYTYNFDQLISLCLPDTCARGVVDGTHAISSRTKILELRGLLIT